MDSTRSVRHGQTEVGIIEHDGLEFAAYGATVIRREITAYLKYKRPLLADDVERDHHARPDPKWWRGSGMAALALMFRLAKGRFIVGYALGDDGMLFRGELIDNCDRRRCPSPCSPALRQLGRTRCR